MVFAGCLNPNSNGAQELAKQRLIKIVKLNVTKDEDIKAAKELVENNLGDRSKRCPCDSICIRAHLIPFR